VVPAALIAYLWLATLHRGAIACAAPTTFVVGFLLCAGIGSVLGLFRSSLVVSDYLSVSLFATAQVHYVLMGGVLTALLAGLHFWWPLMTGRHYHQLTGRFSGMLYIVGLNLAFFPQIAMGTRGAPQGLGAVPAGMAGLAKVSDVGVAILLAGLVLVAFNLVASLVGGARAGADPWGAGGREWGGAPSSEVNS
jgi:cytochrome c oxidase subunit 1